ncbi:hypothetical protein QR680_012028 [Steinernema hermaphroditum]|uniref:RING-type domain-containing protein n=1 Tax=Steinernema hermaphroditum TaxID=289476 RepID=A0AA39I351_9BILA|nr:hypothetical protein QR680_012028 [Steinernema hermaphroditum]
MSTSIPTMQFENIYIPAPGLQFAVKDNLVITCGKDNIYTWNMETLQTTKLSKGLLGYGQADLTIVDDQVCIVFWLNSFQCHMIIELDLHFETGRAVVERQYRTTHCFCRFGRRWMSPTLWGMEQSFYCLESEREYHLPSKSWGHPLFTYNKRIYHLIPNGDSFSMEYFHFYDDSTKARKSRLTPMNSVKEAAAMPNHGSFVFGDMVYLLHKKENDFSGGARLLRLDLRKHEIEDITKTISNIGSININPQHVTCDKTSIYVTVNDLLDLLQTSTTQDTSYDLSKVPQTIADACQCPVCFEAFVEPKVFPGCGHTVCKGCTEQLKNRSWSTSCLNLALACPVCRKKVTLKVGEELPTNWTLKGLMDATLNKSI